MLLRLQFSNLEIFNAILFACRTSRASVSNVLTDFVAFTSPPNESSNGVTIKKKSQSFIGRVKRGLSERKKPQRSESFDMAETKRPSEPEDDENGKDMSAERKSCFKGHKKDQKKVSFDPKTAAEEASNGASVVQGEAFYQGRILLK